MYVNIIYKSIKNRFNYILEMIQVIKYRTDKRNVKGSDSIHSFLGNRTWLEYSLNNILTLGYFHIKPQI